MIMRQVLHAPLCPNVSMPSDAKGTPNAPPSQVMAWLKASCTVTMGAREAKQALSAHQTGQTITSARLG